jgi:hypothetical protein
LKNQAGNRYNIVLKMDGIINNIFPWTVKLTPEDRNTFRGELVSVFAAAIQTNNWSELDDVIVSWEATAEALTNKQFMEIVHSEAGQREYTEVER